MHDTMSTWNREREHSFTFPGSHMCSLPAVDQHSLRLLAVRDWSLDTKSSFFSPSRGSKAFRDTALMSVSEVTSNQWQLRRWSSAFTVWHQVWQDFDHFFVSLCCDCIARLALLSFRFNLRLFDWRCISSVNFCFSLLFCLFLFITWVIN